MSSLRTGTIAKSRGACAVLCSVTPHHHLPDICVRKGCCYTKRRLSGLEGSFTYYSVRTGSHDAVSDRPRVFPGKNVKTKSHLFFFCFRVWIEHPRVKAYYDHIARLSYEYPFPHPSASRGLWFVEFNSSRDHGRHHLGCRTDLAQETKWGHGEKQPTISFGEALAPMCEPPPFSAVYW